jgi:hypothetical protein
MSWLIMGLVTFSQLVSFQVPAKASCVLEKYSNRSTLSREYRG